MRLIVVGNGFDLHHRLKTSYRDYCVFLKENNLDGVLSDITNSRFFIGNADNLQNENDVFWTDVEMNLRFDYNAMMDECKTDYHPYPLLESENFPDAYQPTSMKEAANAVEKDFENIYKFTTSYLFQWIKSVDIENTDISNYCCFRQDDVFVSFNYTLTLETIYGINPKHVNHIHGCINNELSLQFGNTDNDPIEVEIEHKKNYGDDVLFESAILPASEIFESIAEHLLKDLTDNILKLKNKMQYDNFDEVVIMGHSYSGSDLRYYEEFFVPKFRNAKWTIYCWNEKPEEIVYAEDFFRKNRLNGKTMVW